MDLKGIEEVVKTDKANYEEAEARYRGQIHCVRLLTFYGAVLLFVTNVVANSIVNEVQINAQDDA